MNHPVKRRHIFIGFLVILLSLCALSWFVYSVADICQKVIIITKKLATPLGGGRDMEAV